MTVCIRAQPLFMYITNPQVNGNKVTYDIKVANFEDVAVMAYSVSYDTSQMNFAYNKNFAIPTLTMYDFLNEIPGYVYFSWFDVTLAGVTESDSIVLYQMVFTMKHGTYGNVCFSTYPTEPLFTTLDSTFHSFYVTDDCHSEPFEIVIVTQVSDIASSQTGLIVQSLASDGSIIFKLEKEQTLSFELVSLNGQVVESFNENYYTAGVHSLNINTSLPKGLYVLKSELNHSSFAARVIIQ